MLCYNEGLTAQALSGQLDATTIKSAIIPPRQEIGVYMFMYASICVCVCECVCVCMYVYVYVYVCLY